MPTRRPVKGLQTGVEVPGPSRWPTVWPASTSVPLAQVVERAEDADGRGDDHPLRDEQPFAVGQQGFHQCTSGARGTSSGVAMLWTVTPGAPRFASAASIEP